MKRLVTALVLVISIIPALAHPSSPHSDVIRLGVPIAAEAKGVTVTQFRATPDAYGKDPVVVEGVVSKVCWIRGCWMKLSSETGDASIHVTFRGFTVPRDSKGRTARIVGVAKTHTEDGKVHVSFVASGVQLRN